MKILGTGLNGLVGTRITELLGNKYDFQNISRSTGVDITNADDVNKAITSSDAPVVIHLTAKTDVDSCENDRSEDIKILGYKDIKNTAVGELERLSDEFAGKQTAWAINVLGTKNVVEACKKSNKKIIYISTDFIFDGEKGNYSEEDQPNPVNWYGQTKYEGEKIVRNAQIPFLILRIAYPFGKPFEKKKDFAQAILARLQSNQVVLGITDHIFTPTCIDDVARCIDELIHHNLTGIFHTVGSQALTPYDAAVLIAQTYGFDPLLIQKTTRGEFFKGRATRPYNLSLKNDKIKKLEIRMKGFEEGLKLINSKS